MAGVIALTSPFLQPTIAVECRGWLAIGWQLIGYVGATAGRRTARPAGRRGYSKRCQPLHCVRSPARDAPNWSHPAACVSVYALGVLFSGNGQASASLHFDFFPLSFTIGN